MREKVWRTGIAVLLLMFLPAVSHGSEDVISIKLRSAADVTGGKVSLGDIADISGGNDDVIEMLSEITVCHSLAPGARKALLPRDIETELLRNRINLRYVRINGESQVIVSHKSTNVTSEELKEVVLDYVYEHMPWEKDEVVIELTRVLPAVSLPDKSVEYSVTRVSGSKYVGFSQFVLRIFSNGELKHRFVVGVNIRVFKDVVVSSRQLGRRSIIRNGDIEVQKRELKDTNKTPFLSVSEIVGKRLKTSIPANRILYQSSVEEAPLITRDQYVTIRGKMGAVCVTTRGRAIEEGKSGEFIQVKNLASGKIVIAKVTSPEIVDILTNMSN